ncbi:MAG: PAS domain S-box protein [Flavobacterium sp.]|nr:MAG: PAS domain S-box protein [Flavobacterium sp.]
MSHGIFSSFSSEELQSVIDNRLFRGMLDAMPVGVAVLEYSTNTRNEVTRFTYTFANKTAEHMAKAQLKGNHLFLNDDALLFNSMAELVETGNREEFVYHYQKDPEKWIHYSISRFASGVLLTYQNVTERKKTNLVLQHRKQLMDDAQAISHTGSFEWDFVENKIHWSDELYRIFGLKPQSEPITGDLFLSLVHPEDAARVAKKHDTYRKIPGVEEIQYKLKLRDGSVRHVTSRFQSFRGKSGKVTHLIGLLHDVTEKRVKSDEARNLAYELEMQSKGKEKREATLEDYKRIIQNSQSAIVSIDRKGSIISWNPAAEKLYGYSASDAIGRQIANLIVPERDRAATAEVFNKLFAGEEVPDFEAVKKCRGDREIDVLVNLVPQKDVNGKVTGVVITSKDITEIKKAKDSLRETYDELDLKNKIFTSAEVTAKIGTWTWNRNTGETICSDNMLRLFGLEPGEIEPSFEAIENLIHPDDRESLCNSVLNLIELRRQPEAVEYRLTRKDGEERIFSNRASATKNSEGHDILIGITEDITRRKQSERELVRIKDALAKKATDKYHTLFNSIAQGFCILEMIRDESGNPIDYRFLEVNGAFEKLTGIIDAVGKTISEFGHDPESRWLELCTSVVRSQKPMQLEQKTEAPTYAWFEIDAMPIEKNKVAFLLNDVTERRRSKENLALLAEISQDLVQMDDIGETLVTVSGKIARHFHAAVAAFSEIDEAA